MTRFQYEARLGFVTGHSRVDVSGIECLLKGEINICRVVLVAHSNLLSAAQALKENGSTEPSRPRRTIVVLRRREYLRLGIRSAFGTSRTCWDAAGWAGFGGAPNSLSRSEPFSP